MLISMSQNTSSPASSSATWHHDVVVQTALSGIKTVFIWSYIEKLIGLEIYYHQEYNPIAPYCLLALQSIYTQRQQMNCEDV